MFRLGIALRARVCVWARVCGREKKHIVRDTSKKLKDTKAEGAVLQCVKDRFAAAASK